jgi:hypothetical protein
MIEMKNIAKTYHLGEVEVPIVKGINLLADGMNRVIYPA